MNGEQGVRFRKRDKLFEARIQKNGKRYALGSFKNLKDAAKAYEEGSKQHHGEFARND